jgi:hypothetical protein
MSYIVILFPSIGYGWAEILNFFTTYILYKISNCNNLPNIMTCRALKISKPTEALLGLYWVFYLPPGGGGAY